MLSMAGDFAVVVGLVTLGLALIGWLADSLERWYSESRKGRH